MNILSPFTVKQREYLMRCLNSWFNVAEGGKRGGKNVLQTMAFCICLDSHADRLHLIAGVTTATARLNIMDCDGYGLLNYFEGRCRQGLYQNRDCLYIRSLTGEKIVLISGGGKSGDEKLIKGNTYALAYVTEANECAEPFLREVFDRTLSSKDRKIFHDLNPKSEGHWYYSNILAHHEAMQGINSEYGFNYGHFTIANNMSISDEQLRTVIATYDQNSVWYQRDILGKRKQAEGLVYPMFSDGRHVVSDAPRKYEKYLLSCDYGTINPTSMGLWGLIKGKWYRMREYYFDSRREGKQRTDEEHYQALEALAGNLPIHRVVVDPSAASFIECIRRHGRFMVDHANNRVLDGIRNVATQLQAGNVLICDTCKDCIREFGLYSWDERYNDDRPIKENDHAMDDVRYFVQSAFRPDRFSF